MKRSQTKTQETLFTEAQITSEAKAIRKLTGQSLRVCIFWAIDKLRRQKVLEFTLEQEKEGKMIKRKEKTKSLTKKTKDEPKKISLGIARYSLEKKELEFTFLNNAKVETDELGRVTVRLKLQ